MNLTPVPSRQAGLTQEQQLDQLYDYVNNLDSALRTGSRFGWPVDCPLLLANSTSAPGAAGIPTYVNATGLYQQIALSWDLDTNPGILDYEVARATSSGGALTIIGHTSGNCFLDSSLADSTAYFYKIQARLIDGSTYSGLSAEATATTLANDTTADAQLAIALRLLQLNTYPPQLSSMQFTGAAVAAGSNPVFLGRTNDATELNVAFRTPFPGFVTAMYSGNSVAPVGAETYIYTLRVAVADTALTHTVTGAATNGSSSGSIPITANSRVSIKLVTSAGAAVANHMVTIAIRALG